MRQKFNNKVYYVRFGYRREQLTFTNTEKSE